MKVYNINNSREFFEKLTACKGTVELVNEEGKRLRLADGPLTPDTLLMTYFKGTIREMELIFQNSEDCARILSYLMNKRHLAA
ncbi:MAG: polya polymerase [Lachnospiraceae bacterium]|jgi:hypothetical protein